MTITSQPPVPPKTSQEKIIDELVERLATEAAREEEDAFELGTAFAQEVLHERETICQLK